MNIIYNPRLASNSDKTWIHECHNLQMGRGGVSAISMRASAALKQLPPSTSHCRLSQIRLPCIMMFQSTRRLLSKTSGVANHRVASFQNGVLISNLQWLVQYLYLLQPSIIQVTNKLACTSHPNGEVLNQQQLSI